MTSRGSLRRRLVQALTAYVVLLSVVVLVHGYTLNERAEALVWESLLTAEFEHLLGRRSGEPGYQWRDTDTLVLFGDARPLPPEVAALGPGLHDEVRIGDGQYVLMVREVDGARLALAIDISEFERGEREIMATLLGSTLLIAGVLGLFAALGAQRLVRPLTDLARQISRLVPGESATRIEVPASAGTELGIIAEAVNGYIDRNAEFVERERAFIDSASHELRTPISVIAGAAELAMATPAVPPEARAKLARIHRTTRDMERLLSLLLVLAKDPARLAQANDRILLDELLPEIVDDHRPLAAASGLAIELAPLPRCELVAPVPVVQAAIANLLRNAIENSDSGVIHVRLRDDAVVEIEDPGQGMSPEEISAIYARAARGGGRDGGGIGLDLITRLCRHLGWVLEIESQQGRGTRARLDFGRARRLA